MFLLVSVDRTKEVLRITHDDDDLMLELLISAASRAVTRYLKGQAGTVLSIDSPPNSPPADLESVPEDVAVATIYLVGVMYRNPDNDTEQSFMDGQLPKPVKAMLHMLRDPALA